MKARVENSQPCGVFRSGRTIYFFDTVDENSSAKMIHIINTIQEESITKPISIIINSPGGNCYDGLAVYDAMRACRAPITTIGIGMVASMGFIIFLAGDRRVTAPSTRFLNHQLTASHYGRFSDLEIEHKEYVRLMTLLRNIVIERTGMSMDEVIKTTDKGDMYYYADDAIKAGIAHEIVEYVKKMRKK